MPDETNSPSDILGSTAGLKAGSAIEQVQAAQIKRLEAEKQQAEQAQANTPAPLSAAEMMQEAVQEAQGRTESANARAAGFDAPLPLPAPLPPPARRAGFDAAAANARAARPLRETAIRQPESSPVAPANAGSAFDAFAYDERIHAQNIVSGGYASTAEWDAADDPSIAPSPSYARVGMDEDLWVGRVMANGDKIDRVDAGFANRVPEYQQEVEAQRAASIASVVADSPSYSLRDRYASFKADWAEVGAAYRQSANEPLADKFDSFADTAARYGVDTGVLGERVRGLGQTAVSRIAEDLKTPFGPIQYSYAVGSLLQGSVRDYAANNSGNYLTPEQQQSAAAGLLPGIGALAGTVAGSIVPGLGSWAGAIGGQAIGGGIQGVLDAGFERQQAVRETGDIYSVQTGASTDALREFTDSLRQANVATKEAYAAFSTLASAGPGMGSGTLPGVALMSGALGERYNPALSGLSHALSGDPILRALQPQISATGGNLGAGRLGDIAVAEAFSGDWQASNDAATLAEGSLTNPQYARDMNRHSSVFSAGGAARFLTIGALFHPVQNAQDVMALGRLWTGQDDQYLPGADAEKARIAKDRADAYNLYTQGSSAEEIAKTGVGLAAARLGIAENQGATDAQLAATAQGLYGAVAAGVPKLTQEAAGIDGYLADHPHMDAATRLKMQQTRDGYLTEAYGMEGQQAQVQKVLFGRSLETEQSGFALSESQAAYSGQSFASRAGSYRTQEDFLTGVADNPGPLSPSERNSLRQSVLDQRRTFQQGEFGEEEASFGLSIVRGTLSGRSAASLLPEYDRQAGYLQSFAQSPNNLLTATERTGIEQSAVQMRYEAGRSVYQEAMGWQGVQDVQGQGQIAVAQTYGSPMDVYHADIAQIANQQAQVGIIDDRLRQNIPMSERIPLTSQRQGIENDIAIAPERARVDAYNAQGSILADNQAAGRSLLDRNTQVYGAKAFTPDIFAADQANVSLYTGAENGSPLGSLQRAVFGRQRADAEAQMTRDRDSSYRFGDAAQRVGDMQAEGAYHRALEAPYMSGGPESDPLLRGNALERVYKGDLAGVEAALARTPHDSPAYEYDTGLEQDYKNKIVGIERDRRFALFNAVPNTIIGGGAMGNSVSSFSLDALTAAYAPNVLQGSWGHSVLPRGGTLPGSLPGNAYDAFQKYKTGTSSIVAAGYPGGTVPAGYPHTAAPAGYPGSAAAPASGTAGMTEALQTLAHNTNNQQVVMVLQQMLQVLSRIEGASRAPMTSQGGPPMTGGSRTLQNNQQSFNPNRPGR